MSISQNVEGNTGYISNNSILDLSGAISNLTSGFKLGPRMEGNNSLFCLSLYQAEKGWVRELFVGGTFSDKSWKAFEFLGSNKVRLCRQCQFCLGSPRYLICGHVGKSAQLLYTVQEGYKMSSEKEKTAYTLKKYAKFQLSRWNECPYIQLIFLCRRDFVKTPYATERFYKLFRGWSATKCVVLTALGNGTFPLPWKRQDTLKIYVQTFLGKYKKVSISVIPFNRFSRLL